ncbi:MAG: glycoside hydrolase family 16 protein [Limisphaerales bacterium]
MWPALWLLGVNIKSVGWPACGEIDVVEANGATPYKIQSSLHSGSDETGFYNFRPDESATDFHSYVLDWSPTLISFSIDDHVYETQNSWSSSLGAFPAPFNAPFFLLMNLAVGGQYVGNPSIGSINAGTVFPAEMQVDYVRVYKQTVPLQISAGQSSGNIILTWPSNIVCHLPTADEFVGHKLVLTLSPRRIRWS